MLDALADHFPPQAEWTRPGGGLFIWATLPDFIDTTDLLARALRDNVAFVPGEQAYLDGRGRSSMRLNFSGCGEEDIREGSAASARRSRSRWRCTGRLPGEEGGGQRAEAGRGSRAPRWFGCPRRRSGSGAPRREPGGRSQGRPLARAAGLASLGRRAAGRARAPRPRGGGHRRRPRSDSPPARGGPGGVRGDARPRRGGRDDSGSCSRSSGSPTPVRRPGLRPRDGQGAGQAPDAGGRDPHTRVLRLQRDRLPRPRRRRGPARDRGAARLRSWSSPRARARPSASSSPGRPPTCPAPWWPLLLRRQGRARALRVRARPGDLDPGRRGPAGSGGGAAERRLLRLRVALRDRPHVVRLSRRPSRGHDRARPGIGAPGVRAPGLLRRRGWT